MELWLLGLFTFIFVEGWYGGGGGKGGGVGDCEEYARRTGDDVVFCLPFAGDCNNGDGWDVGLVYTGGFWLNMDVKSWQSVMRFDSYKIICIDKIKNKRI